MNDVTDGFRFVARISGCQLEKKRINYSAFCILKQQNSGTYAIRRSRSWVHLCGLCGGREKRAVRQ